MEHFKSLGREVSVFRPPPSVDPTRPMHVTRVKEHFPNRGRYPSNLSVDSVFLQHMVTFCRRGTVQPRLFPKVIPKIKDTSRNVRRGASHLFLIAKFNSLPSIKSITQPRSQGLRII
jgi:hypothetical protein